MKCQNDKFELSLAKPENSQQLLNIYECGDFKGSISVLYTRRPDPFKSLMFDGERAVIPIVTNKDNGVIAGMGACIIRKAYINGEIKNTGYLTGLKALPEYRKRIPYISEVYKYLYDLTKDKVDIYYTTILKDNKSVQKMLERKRRNMPEYIGKGEYTVYCFSTGSPQNGKEYTLENSNKKELDNLYIERASSFNFSPENVNLHGLTEEEIYILRNQKGETVAACAVWNQQSYKQYVITEYKGIYKYIKKLPINLIGCPNLPKENIPINYASIAMFSVKDNDCLTAEHFIKKIAEKLNKYDFLMLGFFENHPLITAMDKINCIKYHSKLYTVHWDNNSLRLDNRPINLEVGLL